MKRFLAFWVLIIPFHLHAQVEGDLLYILGDDTTHVPFMYVGKDTLEYVDGGSIITKVRITSIEKDFGKANFIIKGIICANNDEAPYEDFGIVMTGKIELVEAELWQGKMKTGRIIRDSEIMYTKKGKFEITVPVGYQHSVIFTAIGTSVVDIPLEKLLNKYFKK